MVVEVDRVLCVNSTTWPVSSRWYFALQSTVVYRFDSIETCSPLVRFVNEIVDSMSYRCFLQKVEWVTGAILQTTTRYVHPWQRLGYCSNLLFTKTNESTRHDTFIAHTRYLNHYLTRWAHEAHHSAAATSTQAEGLYFQGSCSIMKGSPSFVWWQRDDVNSCVEMCLLCTNTIYNNMRITHLLQWTC